MNQQHYLCSSSVAENRFLFNSCIFIALHKPELWHVGCLL